MKDFLQSCLNSDKNLEDIADLEILSEEVVCGGSEAAGIFSEALQSLLEGFQLSAYMRQSSFSDDRLHPATY
jgi:hypothetical protein